MGGWWIFSLSHHQHDCRAMATRSAHHRAAADSSSVPSYPRWSRHQFLASLANRSLCFLGPADTACPLQRDLCSTCDVVLATNNMASLLEPSSCYALVLVTNRFFSHRLVERPTLARKAAAILCTAATTCEMLHTHGVHNKTLAMAPPAVRGGVGNSLAYVLKAVCDINGWSGCASFSRMHITGVTFYDHGQQYIHGYGLLNVSSRHDAEANKAYALAWVRSVGRLDTRTIAIDYPQCTTPRLLPRSSRSEMLQPMQTLRFTRNNETSTPECSVTLLEQQSQRPCLPDQTFGCTVDKDTAMPRIWVDKGCRGAFQLSTTNSVAAMPCGTSGGRPRQTCSSVSVESCPCSSGDTAPFRCASCDRRGNQPHRTIVTMVLHYERWMVKREQRPKFLREQIARVLRVRASLAATRSTLPLMLLMSAQPSNTTEVHQALATLQRVGVHVELVSPVPVPTWAAVWYRGTFAKLGVLNASLHHGRLLFVDQDVVAMRNIDYLQWAASPAFVFYPEHYTATGQLKFGINSGVMLLHIRTQQQLDAAWQLFTSTRFPVGDGGDQAFWEAWAAERWRLGEPLHELSRRHNMLMFDTLSNTGCFMKASCSDDANDGGWFSRVVLWHKPLGYKPWKLSARATAYLHAWLEPLDDNAHNLTREAWKVAAALPYPAS